METHTSNTKVITATDILVNSSQKELADLWLAMYCADIVAVQRKKEEAKAASAAARKAKWNAIRRAIAKAIAPAKEAVVVA